MTVRDPETLNQKIILTGEDGVYLYQDQSLKLSDLIRLDLPEWEQVIISRGYAIIEGQSGWSLHHLKKTL